MPTQRHIPLDALRTLAAFMVVGIHTSGQYIVPSVALDGHYYAALLVQSFVQIGVPLFFMLSGAFALGAERKQTIAAWYRRRIPRLLIPLVVWLPFYYLWFFLKGDDVLCKLKEWSTLEGYYHLWFLPVLLGLYLLAPLLDALLHRLHRRKLQFVLVLSLICISAFVQWHLEYWEVSLPLNAAPFLYIGYFLMGFLLRTYPIRIPRLWLLLYGLGTCGLFVALRLAFGSYWHEYPLRNLSPFVIVASVALFGYFAQQSSERSSRFSHWLASIAPYTMGIYLVHIAVLNVVTKPFLLYFPSVMQSALLSIAVRWVLTIAVSYALVLLFKRFSWLRPII